MKTFFLPKNMRSRAKKGFFVMRWNDGYRMGFATSDRCDLVPISRELYRAFRKDASENAKKYAAKKRA